MNYSLIYTRLKVHYIAKQKVFDAIYKLVEDKKLIGKLLMELELK